MVLSSPQAGRRRKLEASQWMEDGCISGDYLRPFEQIKMSFCSANLFSDC